jgi:hypothetical protein
MINFSQPRETVTRSRLCLVSLKWISGVLIPLSVKGFEFDDRHSADIYELMKNGFDALNTKADEYNITTIPYGPSEFGDCLDDSRVVSFMSSRPNGESQGIEFVSGRDPRLAVYFKGRPPQYLYMYIEDRDRASLMIEVEYYGVVTLFGKAGGLYRFPNSYEKIRSRRRDYMYMQSLLHFNPPFENTDKG